VRGWLVALIVLATAGFVIGTSIERHDSRHEPATESHSEKAEGHEAENAGESDADTELRPLGVDIEAVPFIVLAALVSLGFAGLGYARPSRFAALLAIAIAMVAFGALDVREAFHQADESKTGLVILACVVGALHLAAAAVAAAMARPRAGALA
jgi:hypothetical protein